MLTTKHGDHQHGKDGKGKKGKGMRDKLIRSNEEFTFKIEDAFGAEGGTRPTLSATLADGSSLPTWLTFDPIMGVFSGMPPADTLGALPVKVTATSTTMAPMTTTFVLKTAKPIRGEERGGRIKGTEDSDICDGSMEKDVMDGGSGNDDLFGGEGNDRLLGGMGDDKLEGGAGKDKMVGGDGNDSLNGGLDDDKLVGAAGDDILTCGGGRDKMVGGSGKDTFVLSSGEGFAVINDFRAGQDLLGLAAGINFADLTIAFNRGKTSIALQDDLLAVMNGKVSLVAANFVAQV
jgi:Ca2+-binding RTX toxin-like protein